MTTAEDVVSRALSALRFSGSVYSLVDASAPWAMSAGPSTSATFHGVERGSAWLTLKGEKPVFLEQGDVAIISRGSSHVVASAAGLSATPFYDVVRRRESASGPVAFGGGGAVTTMLCGAFHLEDNASGPPLLSLLPPLLHIRRARDRAGGPAAILELIGREIRAHVQGGDAVVARLADVLFVKVVQECIGADADSGWLAALQDQKLAHALTIIHERPKEPWTVASLARAVGMSRSAFALRFGELVREAPVRYLTRWRLHQAARELRSGKRSMNQIAELTGYGSEAALSRAFKREFGVAPANYRRETRFTTARDRSSANA